jgi:hypothetical protein
MEAAATAAAPVGEQHTVKPFRWRCQQYAMSTTDIQPDPCRRHRWYPSSLRWLLAIMLLASIATIWFVVNMQPVWKQQETEQYKAAKLQAEQDLAIAEIEKLGGKVVIDKTSPGNPVLSVYFPGTKVTDAGLKHVKGLTQLKELYVRGSQITDAGLESLKELQLLQVLDLNDTVITDVGLKHLAGLTELRKLWIGNTRVTDVGLEQLKTLTQLQALDCSNTPISDAGLAHLLGLKRGLFVQLDRTLVTSNGLRTLNKSGHGARSSLVPYQSSVPGPSPTIGKSPSGDSGPGEVVR